MGIRDINLFILTSKIIQLDLFTTKVGLLKSLLQISKLNFFFLKTYFIYCFKDRNHLEMAPYYYWSERRTQKRNVQCVSGNMTILICLWWFGFRLEPIFATAPKLLLVSKVVKSDSKYNLTMYICKHRVCIRNLNKLNLAIKVWFQAQATFRF